MEPDEQFRGEAQPQIDQLAVLRTFLPPAVSSMLLLD